jgi:glycosyltransferase involved in cell wall biosynthesis
MGIKPLVSVVIATYNRAHFLRQTIESVFQQRFEHYELIVVDDGSTDDTRVVSESLGPRVRYYYQPNQGPAAARNFGVQQACAPWIAFQDSDDICTPDHLETLYGYLRDHPECALVFGNGAYLDGPEHNRSTIIPGRKSQRLQARGVGLDDLFAKSIVRLQAAIISKGAYAAVGGMDESLRICHDLDLFFRLFLRFPVKYIDRVVFLYRKHQGNITRNEDLRLTENIKVIEKLRRDFPDAVEMLGARKVAQRIAYRYYRLAKGRWRRNEFVAARQAIDAAVGHSPYSLKYRIYQHRWSASHR